MKKIHLTMCTLLILCLLLFSSLQSVLAITVGSAVFCPNNYIPPPTGPDTEYEVQLSTAYCTAINSLLSSKYGGLCYLEINATRSDYTTILGYLQTACDEIVVFSKGHRGIIYDTPFNHITLLDHNGINNVIDDQHIYPNTSYAKNNVTFIWHCETSEYYASSPWIYGMPYCWTHDYAMDPYVTYGDHVYLGWVDQSPQFETAVNVQYKFAEVACWFWYYTCNGFNVQTALNLIGQNIFGAADFFASELDDYTAYHGPLKVYGDMSFYLPEE